MKLHSAPITFNNYSFDFYVHDPEIDRMVSRKIVKRGPWEPDLSKIWMDAIGKDDIVLDIGANIGWYSKLQNYKDAQYIRMSQIQEILIS